MYHFRSVIGVPIASPFGPTTLRTAQKLSSMVTGCWKASTPTLRSVEICTV